MGLDSVELVLSVEDHFEIKIPDRVAQALVTVGSLHALVVTELERLGRHPVVSSAVFEELRDLICKQLGIKPERVLPEANFVRDLQLN